MTPFPPHAFVPATGTLSQWIVEDPDRGVPPHLSFSIDIPFEPFQWNGEEIATALWIGGLDAKVRHWRELARSEPFPDPFELDGIVRLFELPNPVEIERLRFGEISSPRLLQLELQGQIDFEAGGNEEYGVLPCSLVLELAVGPLRVSKSIDRRCQGDPAKIDGVLRGLLDLDGLGPLEKVAGGWQYPVLGC